MMKRIVAAAMCAAMLLCSGGLSARKRVVILHTNDTHSHIDPMRGEDAGTLGVIERAAFRDSVVNADGRKNVLYLDAGDFDQGTSYFNVLGGDLEARLLKKMKVDAVALGNHEFDNGIEELARRMRIYGGHVLCANYDFTGTALERVVKPYAVFRRGGYRIGVIGLLCDVRPVVAEKVASQLSFMDPVPVTDDLAGFLRDRKRCDIVLVLSHLGFDGDCHVARNVHGVNAIIGGHSHTNLSKSVVTADPDGNPVTVVTAYRWGAVVGRLEICD